MEPSNSPLTSDEDGEVELATGNCRKSDVYFRTEALMLDVALKLDNPLLSSTL